MPMPLDATPPSSRGAASDDVEPRIGVSIAAREPVARGAHVRRIFCVSSADVGTAPTQNDPSISVTLALHADSHSRHGTARA